MAENPSQPTTIESDELPTSIFDKETRLERGFKWIATTKQRQTLTEQGTSPPVAKHRIYYEIHGDPSPHSQKLIWIMGLSNSCFGWNLQIKHFSKLKGFQCLTFDNRGVGSTDSPRGLYLISEMAKDVIELLEQVGWLNLDQQHDERKLNVVGVSMGGMCALELATMIPQHINALMLTSTKSGTKSDLPNRKVLYTFGRILTGTVWSPEQGVSLITDMLFPKEYLDSIDSNDQQESKRTKRQIHEQDFLNRYKLTRRQTMTGRLGQLSAVFRHQVDQQRLKEISKNVYRIGIITGDQDNLINPQRSFDLHHDLPGSTLKVVKGAGHALPAQIPDEYNDWILSVLNQPVKN
ncbi:hypothetical protein OIO90_003655 [Microbotryomycetes sp. JL221]|nr:hypothetical protein OIO90_003655 [Microbotryomycetes sp. JL221]